MEFLRISRINLLLLCILIVQGSQAQSFSVKPTSLQYPLEPGQSGYRHITVTNMTDEPKTYTVSKGDFMPDSLGNTLRYPSGTTPRSCSEWLQISPSTFDLAPNESKKIRIAIEVPPGEGTTKWAELYIRAEEELLSLPALADKSLQSQLQAQGRIAVPVLQSPASNVAFEAKVANMRAANYSEVKMYYADLINSGDKLVTGQILRTITHLDTGQKKQLPPFKVGLLPDERKTIEFPLPDDLVEGSYQITTIWQVDYQKRPKGARLQIELE